MTELARNLLAGFETTHYTVGLQLGDLKNSDAVRRARGDSGASISWILGHLMSFRCMALKACGVDRDDPYQERFSFDVPATDGGDYPDLSRLHEEWNGLHAELAGALAAVDAERLAGSSGLPGPYEQKSALEALSMLVWHEAYHVGVIGMLRAQWGYPRTHELVMNAM